MIEKKGFTIECTLIAKGIFVLLLLFHHVFFGNTIYEKTIVTHVFSQETIRTLAMYSKICVGGFAFLSAYGMTYKIMQEPGIKGLICLRRLISFVSNCIFIYCIAVVYRRFIAVQEIKDIYLDVKGEFNPLYMVIDGLGLAHFFNTPQINVTWWYCSFAILLILAMPAVYSIYTNMGEAGKFLPGLALLLSMDSLIVIFILGVTCAKEDWFFKLDTWTERKRINKFIAIIFCIVSIVISYIIFESTGEIKNIQFWAGAVIACISMILFKHIPILNTILKQLGKYSTFIFLSHTFIYYYFYEDFIYSFSEAYKIFFVLLILSYLLAVLLTVLKRITRYDNMVRMLQYKVESYIINRCKTGIFN